MKRLAVLLYLLAASLVQAEEQRPLQKEDFAYGMALTVSGKNAMYSLTLPAEVYQGCTRPDLGDLRVLNSSGPVPHLLRQPQREQTARPAQSLPFFPLSQTQDSGHSTDLGIAVSSSGAIIAFSTGTPSSTQTVSAYVIDASTVQHKVDWLELSWTGQSEQFSASVRIDSSDDLNTWQPLVASAALAKLSFGGHDLLRNRIEIQGQTAGKYLRLSWPPGKDGVSLTAVKAGYEQEEQAKPRTLLTLVSQPESKATAKQGSWLYTTGGFFPVDQLNIRLPEQNSLAAYTVFSRADAQAAWQRRDSLLAWRLTINGVNLDNSTLHLAPTTDRFWRLESEESGNSAQAPVLELGWLPGQLVFMAQGEGPYTLAYGRVGLSPAHSQVAQLLKAVEPVSSGKLIEAAQAGPQLVLGGKELLTPVVEIPWRVWLLWAGLIAGVLAVGAMALKLFKEMNQRP